MATVFVKNGVVIGKAQAANRVSVSNNDPDAVSYSADDSVNVGDLCNLVEGVPVFETVIPAPKLSPVEFKLCFTALERVAIKAARLTDPILEDAYSILDDPRLTFVDLSLQSNKDMIDYMATQGLITADRAVEIKTGLFK